MKKKLLLVLTILFAMFHAKASHIVGGELELLHLDGYFYRLNLVYYFDVLHNDFKDANGNPIPPEQEEPTLTVGFFQKSNNVFIQALVLSFLSRVRVDYTQPTCSSQLMVSDKLIYTAIIELSPNQFGDPGGYYVSWQRCCRNYQITNIYSQPIGAGIYAGQTFYLEFPPVIKDGQPFVNSSPHLFPPLNDYACPGRLYYKDFAGVDDDGDSIVYSLTTPLNVSEATAIPDISPAPYPLVTWRPGYDSTDIIRGSPDLKISPAGRLTCVPVNPGLFVFAVKVREYRNGVKIGETRRDYQMLVSSGCEPDQAPVITGKKLYDPSFTYVDTMSVVFSDSVANGNRCIIVQVGDPDSQDPLHDFSENVTIKAIPISFKSATVNTVLPKFTSAKLTNGSTVDFKICFNLCPQMVSAYQLGIIAYDDACALPESDTLKVTVSDDRPPNTSPYFSPKLTNGQINEGDSGSWPFVVKDVDGDNLTLSVVGEGFSLGEAGITLNVSSQKPGNAIGSINWDAFCKVYNIVDKTDFRVKVLVEDQDPCNVVHLDSSIFLLHVILPEINPHLKIYDESNTTDLTSGTIPMNLGHLVFNVVGTDSNPLPNDSLHLTLLQASGLPAPAGYAFNPATSVHTVQSQFTWDVACDIFKDGIYTNDYTFKFLVENDHCKRPKTDTAFVNVKIKDIDSNDSNFLPGNVITTSPDHCNDFFAIEGFESEPDCNGHVRVAPIPPADNCSNRFENVKIYDRWGKQVYESNERKFRWYASSESAGVYYYIIYYTQKKYKGNIIVIN